MTSFTSYFNQLRIYIFAIFSVCTTHFIMYYVVMTNMLVKPPLEYSLWQPPLCQAAILSYFHFNTDRTIKQKNVQKLKKKKNKYITKWCYLLGVPLVTSKHPLKHSPRARILPRASGVDTFNTVWQPPATSGLLGGERIETSTCQHLLTSAHARVRPRAGVDKVRTEENELKKSTHVYLFSSLYLGLNSVN